MGLVDRSIDSSLELCPSRRFRLTALQELAPKSRLNDAPVSFSVPLITHIGASLRFECKSTAANKEAQAEPNWDSR